MSQIKILSLLVLLALGAASCGPAPVECPGGFADDGRGGCVQSNGTGTKPGDNQCFYDPTQCN